MELPSLLIDIIILLVVLAGMIFDLRSRKIYNWLTMPAMVGGILLNGLLYGSGGLISAVGGLVFCFLIFAMFYIWGEGLGPGDVKLMGAVGAFLGWPGAITALALTAISGGFFAILLLAIKGKLLSTIKRAVLLLVFTFSPQRRQKLWQQSEKIYLPYGPAIFLGTMLTVVGKHFG